MDLVCLILRRLASAIFGVRTAIVSASARVGKIVGVLRIRFELAEVNKILVHE